MGPLPAQASQLLLFSLSELSWLRNSTPAYKAKLGLYFKETRKASPPHRHSKTLPTREETTNPSSHGGLRTALRHRTPPCAQATRLCPADPPCQWCL